MKRFVLVPLALLALATSARSETDAKQQAEPPVVKKTAPGQAAHVRVITVKAKVAAVDQEKRTITLEGKDGKTEKFAVGPNVKRLNEIAPGDLITVKVEQGLLLQAVPEGEKPLGPAAAVDVQRAGAEKAPGGSAQVTLVGHVTVTAVDHKSRTVVLETAKGELLKVKADPSIDLTKVKAGQKFDGVYTESVAISVEKAKPPQKM